jgi:hypothetical protein
MHWRCCLHLSLHYRTEKCQSGLLCGSLCYLPCLLLHKNHRSLLYSDCKHSWSDPSASLIFLRMALMIKCRFAYRASLAACCAVSCACCFIKITGHCCTGITKIASQDQAILNLVRCKLADSLFARVARMLTIAWGAGDESCQI